MIADQILIKLEKDFAGFTLDVDLKLPAAGINALFGHSGSGKTTLLRCMAGLEQADGRILVKGETWQDDRYLMPTHKRPLGYVFQEAGLFPHLSVSANLNYGLKRVKDSKQKVSLEQAIELLGIEHLLDRKPDKLSGGERQRVAIAQALVMGPQVLLMDEPLAALDQARKLEFFPYLERLHRELQIPVLYVTHSIDEVARLADYLVLLEAGRVIADGPLSEVLSRVDLPFKLGEEDAVVLNARVVERDAQWRLARSEFCGGSLWARDMGFDVGSEVRLRVLARDVSLALEPQSNSSVLNALPAVVDQIGDGEHPAVKLVRVMVGDSPILCRLTERSVDSLKLSVGKKIWTQVKSIAIIE